MDLLKEQLKDEKIALAYLGSFSDEITDKLIGISEFYLENRTDLSKLKNKVSFLIAECYQNIVRHGNGAERGTSGGQADFFRFSALDDRVVLGSCNLIDSRHIAGLEKKLLQVNALDAEGLKQLYHEVLLNEGFSEKGGAGLGLIEMARKSGLPIKYLFREAEPPFSRFFLSLEIVRKTENLSERTSIGDLEKSYRDLCGENILILCQGDFSRDTVIPLIDMLQHNFSARGLMPAGEKRSIVTLIEMLQNISKHGVLRGDMRSGIVTIARTPTGHAIETGNFVNEANQKILQTELDAIRQLSADEAGKLYKERLMNPEITAEGNCGIGLLEIARNCNGRFSYAFTEHDGDLFYTLRTAI